MHDIEPFYRWRSMYTAEEDERSPFYGKEYNEFEFSDAIYNYYIHPQWDNMGSPTLFIKILYCNYSKGYVILEFMGEWNDTLHNDIMILKRDIIDIFIQNGIHKFILLGENVLNFHGLDDSYYEEWFDDIYEQEGWIALINFRDHVLSEMKRENIDQYFVLGGELNETDWRTHEPAQLFSIVQKKVDHRLT